jgi:His-Xaa-Ser system protein HxsD
MLLKFDKCIYTKESLLKAMFAFTDVAYIHLSQDDSEYIVDYSSKGDCSEKELQKLGKEIENELLAQTVRHVVFRQTKSIRELILARSLASTIVSGPDIVEEPSDSDDANDADLDKILNNWFNGNE